MMTDTPIKVSNRRRLQLAGIVAAMASAAAGLQACNNAPNRDAAAPGDTIEQAPQDRPVTIVVEPAPTASAEPATSDSTGSDPPPAVEEP